jgi:hypothetical protein
MLIYLSHEVQHQMLLRGWAAPALVKFVVTGTLAYATCWMLADPLVRVPGLRRII